MHTKEPWRASAERCDAIVADEDGGHRGDAEHVRHHGGHLIAESIMPVNRARIVACVNFCAGMTTEELEWLLSQGTTALLRGKAG